MNKPHCPKQLYKNVLSSFCEIRAQFKLGFSLHLNFLYMICPGQDC